MLETFVLVFAATTISVLIGIPVGVMAAHRPWLYTLLRPILDLMQTVPTFVYLIPTLVLFGLGIVPAYFYHYLRYSSSNSPDVLRHYKGSRRTYRGWKSIWRQQNEAAFQSRAASSTTKHYGRYHSVHYVIAFNGGDRRAGRR